MGERVRRLPPITRYLLITLLCTGIALASVRISEELLRYVQTEFGEQAGQRLIDWQTLNDEGKDWAFPLKLERVNAFFNQVRFVNDIRHWGEEDYWATPVELLATNGGDCEDFSIAKYLTLKAMGVPDEQLRIVYVKALELNQAHMVLAWYPTPLADPLILDNLTGDIKPASERKDLVPVYSFNGDGLWLNRSRGGDKRIGEAKKLSRWQDLNSRIIESLR
ncbi:transglutaminase-like cysteine peptidase [Marinobacter sp. CHS3-4]|uniref:transglutaminase-like cysteine peptidase n=1 Tax=Marinobacter sp. CHS3-4 TaxID=3045174 RepID=UPI0024B5811A|nr:transglutaminase-like cysteine peptidase [Marinobacter sp. CHS3-4]MDI9245291.1 transglutaminase-like cysteine peptidase [Marinobacter sp. CHS3-4]